MGRKDQQCRERVVFEEGERGVAAGMLDTLEGRDQWGIRYFPAGHPDTFVVADEVR